MIFQRLARALIRLRVCNIVGNIMSWLNYVSQKVALYCPKSPTKAWVVSPPPHQLKHSKNTTTPELSWTASDKTILIRAWDFHLVSGFTYFARDPKYSRFNEPSKNRIHFLNVDEVALAWWDEIQLYILLDLSLTVEAAPNECVIRTSQP